MGQEKALNDDLEKYVPVVFSFLSRKGRRIYFPSSGIMAQAKEANVAKINASIGIALKDDKNVLCLDSIARNISLDPNVVFPYASSYGDAGLREYWKKNILAKNTLMCETNITTPIVTAGITHALSIASEMFCDESTEIILPNLFWGNYKLLFEVNNGAKLVTYHLFDNGGFNIAGLAEEIAQRETMVLLFNFPNNPTGYTLTQEEQDAVVLLLLTSAQGGKKLLVICDDAYFGLHYENNIAKESLFSRLCSLHENIVAVKIDGPTKEMYVWGLRVGSIVLGNKGLSPEVSKIIEDKFAGLVRSSISCVSHLSQSLLIESSKSNSMELEQKTSFDLLKLRYICVKKTFDEHQEYLEFINPLPFNSGYFFCVKLIDLVDCEEVRKVMLQEYSIGLISLSGENLIRIAFSCISETEIPLVMEKLYLVTKQLAEGKIPSQK